MNIHGLTDVRQYMGLKFLDRKGKVLDNVIEMSSMAKDFILDEDGDKAVFLKKMIKIGDIVVVV